ncbi:MAG: helix-turn-helix domain-containing protein [Pseudomonadota bacterium]
MSNSDFIKAQNTPVPLDKCGMALAAQQLMEKWSMLIIREAFYGVGRFEDFQEDLGIPRSVLTDRLKRLVELEILLRIPYRPQGTRTRFGYILTERGQELALTILALMQWGDKHLNDGVSAISIHDKRSNEPLKVGFVPVDSDEVSLSDIDISFRDLN